MKKSFRKLLASLLALLLTFTIALPASAASSLGKVKSLQSYNIDDDEINLKWKKVSGATGYQVYIYKSDGWKRIGATKKLNFEVDELASAKQYKFKVRAYKQSGNNKVYGSFSKVLVSATEPDEVENVKVSAKNKTSVTLEWSKVKRATGYQVYIYSASKGKYVKKATVKSTSVTIKELKAGTSYKFKIRAYYKLSDKVYYGDFSDALTVKTKAKASSSSASSKNESKLISASEAVSIALNNAKLKKSQVRELEYELDKENGVKVYEVDFKYGKYEYSYEINASSGKILHKEKEIA